MIIIIFVAFCTDPNVSSLNVMKIVINLVSNIKVCNEFLCEIKQNSDYA
jgi:hypothetical protein